MCNPFLWQSIGGNWYYMNSSGVWIK
ncbi:MAG: hypothetical protein ACLUP8_11840 [Ruminococcus sp.]